jgi:hypothetical protein
MFSAEDRARPRSELLKHAVADPRISGAAITGSAADNSEDRWSDIDLAFGVRDAAELPNVLADWTAKMYDEHRALHHLDVIAGAWTYRVFLLASTLQADLAFVPETEFRALAPSFRLVSGKASEPRHATPPSAGLLVGFAWLHALHARTSIARGKLWQAEYMISGIRDNALGLACVRHGLPAVHGRGMDQLPAEVTASWTESLVRRLDAAELSRAFRVAVSGLLGEVRAADPDLAGRLEDALTRLTETAG